MSFYFLPSKIYIVLVKIVLLVEQKTTEFSNKIANIIKIKSSKANKLKTNGAA
jgi:hypothetical protein